MSRPITEAPLRRPWSRSRLAAVSWFRKSPEYVNFQRRYVAGREASVDGIVRVVVSDSRRRDERIMNCWNVARE